MLGRGGAHAHERLVNHRWRFFGEDADWLQDMRLYLTKELRESKHWDSCSVDEQSWVTTWIFQLLMEKSFVRLRASADEKAATSVQDCISHDNSTLMYGLDWLKDFVLDSLVEQIPVQQIDECLEPLPELKAGDVVVLDGMKAIMYNGMRAVVCDVDQGNGRIGVRVGDDAPPIAVMQCCLFILEEGIGSELTATTPPTEGAPSDTGVDKGLEAMEQSTVDLSIDSTSFAPAPAAPLVSAPPTPAAGADGERSDEEAEAVDGVMEDVRGAASSKTALPRSDEGSAGGGVHGGGGDDDEDDPMATYEKMRRVVNDGRASDPNDALELVTMERAHHPVDLDRTLPAPKAERVERDARFAEGPPTPLGVIVRGDGSQVRPSGS